MAPHFKRTEEIKSTLDEAKSLREEAQAELKKYQRLHREASDEAEKITANAIAAAEKIRTDAEAAAAAAISMKIKPQQRLKQWKLKS